MANEGCAMRVRGSYLCGGVLLFLAGVIACQAQTPNKADNSDLELVEKLLIARRDYQSVLEQLRAHYLTKGDVERKTWAEEELIQFHRIRHHAFRVDLVVPPPTLQGT